MEILFRAFRDRLQQLCGFRVYHIFLFFLSDDRENESEKRGQFTLGILKGQCADVYRSLHTRSLSRSLTLLLCVCVL